MMSDELHCFLKVFIVDRMPKYGKHFEDNKCTEDMSSTNNTLQRQ